MLSSAYEMIMLGITVLTMALQFYALFLIFFRSPDQMKSYRFFLYSLTLWEIIFTLFLGLVTEPLFVVTSSVMIMKGFAKYFGTRFSEISIVIMFFACSNVLLFQAYSLIYRYLAVVDKQKWYNSFISTSAKISFYVAINLVSAGIGYGVYSFIVSSEKHEEHIAKVNARPLSEPKITKDDVIVILDGSEEYMTFVKYIMAIYIFVELFCVSLVGVILRTLRKQSAKMSKTTYRLHLQFTVLLLCQLLTPAIFIGGPLLITHYYFLRYNNLRGLGIKLATLAWAIYGLVNASLTISFLSPYRKHFISTFILPWLKPLLTKLGLQRWINETTTKVVNIKIVNVVARSV